MSSVIIAGVLPIEDDIPNLEHTKAPPLFPRSIESDDGIHGIVHVIRL